MANQETPTPITREEFEAGVKFYHKRDKDDIFNLSHNSPNERIRHLWNKKEHYALIIKIDTDGFIAEGWFFDKSVQYNLLFENCFKSEIQ